MTSATSRIRRIPRNRLTAVAAVVLAGLLVAGAAFVVRQIFFGPKTITAYFTSATAIYPGDQVRVSGVKVGTIKSIEPQGTQAKMTLHVDHDVPIPAEAKAVIVTQNLIAARYVELTPAYRTSGPAMADGAVIPVQRTAIPVEWDEVKSQLMRLATDLGPNAKVSTPAISRFIDSAADALDGGNGDKLRQTIAQLSGVARTIANGSGNIVDIIKNLQTFVTALRDSNIQMVQFNNRLATLTSVVNDSKSDLDAALTDLSTAVGEVQRFIAGTRDEASEQIDRLGKAIQPLVDQHMALENILHGAPNALSNFFNDYNADTGTIVGGFGIMNFANPTWGRRVCSVAHSRLHANGGQRERHVSRIGQAVRLVPRPRFAGAQLQQPAVPSQSVPAEVDRPSQRCLQRRAPRTRRGGPEARTARNPAGSVGVRRPEW